MVTKMQMMQFHTLAALYPVQQAAAALVGFYQNLANAAMGEWSRTPRLMGFQFSDPRFGFSIYVSSLGDTIPWDVVAEMALRLKECAMRGLPYLLNLSYGSRDQRILLQIAVRLFGAAVKELTSDLVPWVVEPNGLPGDNLISGEVDYREGSVPSVESGYTGTGFDQSGS
ncbi:MAG: hypothetical protein Q9174_003688 [Haloplaca sp. 1 TL-2023]